MALELIGGAVLGVLFDRFQNEICRVKNSFEMFKPKLEEIEETLIVLYPVIQEIEELNRRLNRLNHGRETIMLRKLLEDGTRLVSKCSKIPRWHIFKQGRYREKLVELDNKILRFHNLYMQAHMARDQKQTLLEMRQMVITMSLNQQGHLQFSMKMLRVVLKMDFCGDRMKAIAMKVASGISGTESVAVDCKEMKMTIVGEIDPVTAVGMLRRRVGHLELLSVGGYKKKVFGRERS